ncbi:hypothetical protein L6164_027340 [Bauhinia variegata]|uniref:Uncharacterized protein n=1 Tax=Bauhinia variegata TaxID=167791 RepID=A0ACB9LSZ5_BAUVA|nr:hypothetical protein L6164_027340 [Bauhinia variegata]
MQMEKAEANPAAASTHVLIFPCPLQGHVNVMLKLAELLALSDLHVTFLNSDYIHHRLMTFSDLQTRIPATYPKFQFKTISDGLPPQHPRSGDKTIEMLNSFTLHGKTQLREILVSDDVLSENCKKPRVNCIIGDGMLGSLTADIGDELGMPVIHFRTISASCFWAYFSLPKVYESGQLPIRGEEDMDRILGDLDGMENLVRCRDLPSFCRESERDESNGILSTLIFETQQSLRARALILNTFEDLEGPVLSHIRLRFPKVYTLGPLHAHLNSRISKASITTLSKQSSTTTNTLWEVDRSCMTWLDAQPPKSVLYVSFGSIAWISRQQLLEIWHGLVNSNKRFLWVIRPDMVVGKEADGDTPVELLEGTKERGFMVGWVPQEEVLAHPAVAGFMTHSGWNSTLESIVAGVPMICWPFFADQQINSRFVSHVWKLGMDMKDVCDRKVLEKMINDLMVDKREEFTKSSDEMANLALKAVREGGSSSSKMDSLVEFIKSSAKRGR